MSLVFINGFDDNMGSDAGIGSAVAYTFVTATFRTGTTSYQTSGHTSTNSSFGYHVVAIPGDATVIVGAAVLFSVANPGVMLAMLCSDNGSTVHVTVTLNPATGLLTAWRGDTGTGSVLGSVTLSGTAILPATWGFWEVKAVLSDTVGEVHVRYNGAAVLDVTGVDTKNAGTKTVFDTVAYPLSYTGTHPVVSVDDFYVVTGTGSPNDFLGDCKVNTLYPDGNGDFSQMLGSDTDQINNYGLVSEAGAPVTTDYVESSTVGARDFYAMQPLSGLAATATVLAVQVTGWCNNPDGGSGRTAKLGVRQGVSEALSAAQPLTAATFLAVRGMFTVDPGTGVAWGQAGVNSVQAGVEVG